MCSVVSAVKCIVVCMCDKRGVICGISTNMTRLTGMTLVGEEAAIVYLLNYG